VWWSVRDCKIGGHAAKLWCEGEYEAVACEPRGLLVMEGLGHRQRGQGSGGEGGSAWGRLGTDKAESDSVLRVLSLTCFWAMWAMWITCGGR